MKVSRLSLTVLGGSLLLAVSAVAGNTTKKSIHLSESVNVEGTQLAAGDYKVEWTGSGPDVKVSILKGKETVATLTAHVESENVSNTQSGYGLRSGKDGEKSFSELFFAGEKFQLKVGQDAADQAQGSASGSTN